MCLAACDGERGILENLRKPLQVRRGSEGNCYLMPACALRSQDTRHLLKVCE
jgi:hypothetical protein